MNVPTQSISGSQIPTSPTTQSGDSYLIFRKAVGPITVPVTAEGGAALRTFDGVAEMAAAQTLVPGTICIIANDTYRVVAASTYTANGVEVVDLASYQAVLLGKTVSLTDTRPITFWTGEYGASGTIELTAGAYRYSLDLTQAATSDVSTTGGVGLQLLGDTTDLTALGAVDGADPAGREAFVSAMATSMQRRGMRAISFRDLVGHSYDATNGAEAVFQAAIDAGLEMRNDEAMRVGFAVALKPKDGMEIYQAQGGQMARIASGFSLFFRDVTGEFLESGVTISATSGGAITVTTTTNTLEVGDRVRIGGMSSDRFLNGTLATVDSVAGMVATLDVTSPVAISNTGFVSRINWVDNIRIIGGEWGTFEDNTVLGRTAYMFMNNSVIDVTVDGTRNGGGAGGLPLVWAGDNNVVKMRCRNFEAASGVGGPRLLGGRNNTVTVRGWVGDDHCNCVPAEDPTSIAYDWDIVGATFDCRGGSHTARMAAVALQGDAKDYQMQCRIHDVDVYVDGYAGNRGVYIYNDEGVGWAGQIDNIRVTGTINGEKQDHFADAPTDIVEIASRVAGGLGRVAFGVSIRENNRSRGIRLAAEGVELDLTGARVAGESSAVEVFEPANIYAGKNTVFITEDPLRGYDDYNGGVNPNNHLVVLGADDTRFVAEGAVFDNIRGFRAAVRMNNNTNVYTFLDECQVYRTSGGTNVRVFSFEANTTAEAGDIYGDFDELFNGFGWGKQIEGPDHQLIPQISAGVLTSRSRNLSILSETQSTPDDVDTITVDPEWPDGTELTLKKQRGDETITLKNGTGNLNLGADVVLNAGGDRAVLRLVNNNWHLLVDAT